MIPPERNAAFVAQMEEVLDLYHEPYDPQRPVIGFDEGGVQLLGQTREPWPAAPGRPAREDYEYTRNGGASLFMAFEPLAGVRHVWTTPRRTAVDFALVLRDLADVHYRDARVVRLVLDNLNTHRVASLYQAFAPAEARRLARRFELHYTPVHGSWLNVAECELSVLSRQCLRRRLPGIEVLRREVQAWEEGRNAATIKVDWQFTTADARIKLRRLYPAIQS